MASPDDLAPEVEDADVAAVAGMVPPSARQPLSKERIVDAALDFIDAHGLSGLTMRRLGNDLGVEAMALYRHVPGKEELLDAVVETLIEGMQRDDDVLDSPRDGWQDFMIRLAHGVRRVALEHPKAFPLVASRPPEAPWLRPPLRSLEWVETFLAGLVDEGFTDEAAVAAYRGYTGFLLGNLLLEVSAHGADLGPLDMLDDGTGDDVAVRAHPTVRRLRALLSEDHANAEFEESLEALMDRMTLLRAEHLST